jgi:hypothetical protein
MDDAEKLIWHPQVPLKVSIFAWRLLLERLPIKTNLVTRGILLHLTFAYLDAKRPSQPYTYSSFGILLVLVGH